MYRSGRLRPEAAGSADPDDWPGHERGSRAYTLMLVALLLAGIATFAQLYSTQALLPLIASSLEVTPAQAALSVSLATGGLALSVIGWAFAADRFGRVPVILTGIIAATVLGLLTPMANSIGLLIVLRLFEGAALGAVPAAVIAYLNEEVDRRHAAFAAGTWVAGTTLGGLLGRLISGPIGSVWGWRIGVLAVAVLAAAAAIGFALCAPRQRGFVPVVGRGLRGDLSDAVRLLAAKLRDRRLVMLYIQAFTLMGSFVAVYNYLGFRIEHPPFSLSTAVSSLIFIAYLAGTFSSTFAARVSERFGIRRTMVVSTLIMAGGALLTLFGQLVVIIVGLVVFTAGFFGAHGLAAGWAGSLAGTGKAQASALYNVGYYSGSSVLGWAGGLLFQRQGWDALALVVAAVVVLTAIAAAVVHRPTDADPESATDRRG